MEADIGKVKANVAKMAAQNASEQDIDGYIASEGTTVDAVKNYTPQKGDSSKSNLDSAILGAAQGMSFNLADEGAAALMTGLNRLGAPNTSPEYDVNLENARKTLGGAQEQNPDFYLGGNIAGSIIPAAGIAATAKGTSLAQRAAELLKAKPVTGAAVTGGVQGGLYGFGEGEGGVVPRLEKGALSGAGGAALGGTLGAAVNRLANSAANRGVAQAARMEGQAAPPIGSADPTDKIIERLRADFPNPDDFQAALLNYAKTKGVSLAELGGDRTQNLAKGAVQYPSGRAAAEEFFSGTPDPLGGPPTGGKINSSPERITESLERNISGNRDFYGSLDDIVANGQAKVAPKYKAAFEANQNVASKPILDILNTPDGKAAFNEANRMMANDRLPAPKGLDFQTLDYVKKALDSKIQAAQSPINGDRNAARIFTKMKNDLLTAMDAADTTGLYKQARSEAGDYLSAESAMQNGRDFRKTNSQLLAKDFSKLNDTEKDAFRAGVVQSMREMVDGTRDGANSYAKTFGNTEIRNKLRAVLPDDAFRKLDKDMWAENRLFDLRNKTVGGSPTTPNAMAAKEFVSQNAELFAEAAKGRPISSAIGFATKEIGKMFDGLSDKTAGQVAEALFETDPQKKLALVRRIANKTGALTTKERQAMQVYFDLADAVKGNKASKLVGGAAAAGVNAIPRITVHPEGDPRNGNK